MSPGQSAASLKGAQALGDTAASRVLRAAEPTEPVGADLQTGVPIAITFLKNAVVLALAVAFYFGLESGYFSPDRPTRSQWDRLQSAEAKPAETVVYAGDLRGVKPGVVVGGNWGRYNSATEQTTAFTPEGIKVDYNDAAWLGAVFDLATYTADRIYRITFDVDAKEQPAAIIVRNRQMDLVRELIPVGRSSQSVHIVTPRGNGDRVRIIFIPDARSNPKGQMTITSLKIEAVKE